jgi:hypothetical protein
MRKILASLAVALVAAGALAQSLQMVNANYPGIYCRFDPSCNVNPTTQSDTFAPTNVAVTCVLDSRSFPGNSTDSQGQYGYEYRLTLNNSGTPATPSGNSLLNPAVTNVLTVDSLSLNFGQPAPFAFGLHASNFVWVVTSGGPSGVAPSSADLSGQKVTIRFDPPLILNTASDQTTSTLYFGMVSPSAPQPDFAVIIGTMQDPVNGQVPFNIRLNVQSP